MSEKGLRMMGKDPNGLAKGIRADLEGNLGVIPSGRIIDVIHEATYTPTTTAVIQNNGGIIDVSKYTKIYVDAETSSINVDVDFTFYPVDDSSGYREWNGIAWVPLVVPLLKSAVGTARLSLNSYLPILNEISYPSFRYRLQAKAVPAGGSIKITVRGVR